MDRDFIRGNKICYNFFEAKKYEQHLKKVYHAGRKGNGSL